MVGTQAMQDDDQLLPPLRGRFAYAEDEGFRVIFRRADGALPSAIAWTATAVVLAITAASLLQEPEFNGIAWMIGGLIDFAAIYVIHALRSGLSRGGLTVDGSERRIFLPEGAEVVFERLLHISVRPAGDGAELVIFHDTGELRFGVRPAAEVEVAAQAVARVGEIPRVSWTEAAGALALPGQGT
jgi:hypothetical protein